MQVKKEMINKYAKSIKQYTFSISLHEFHKKLQGTSERKINMKNLKSFLSFMSRNPDPSSSLTIS